MKNNNSLKLIFLENCPYSIAAKELLNNFKFKLISVNQENKHKYKTKEISTFPQIYMNDILLGGYSDLTEIFDIINKYNNLDIILKYLNKKYSKLKKKDLLRIINYLMRK